ncbi:MULTISPECIES: SUF system Fe-S cluster assembly protein [unclassified Methylophaga]|jgi:FeS assembly SUF system protein|uniref:SUF system Fe-S cluster assembly protein n=1 Tax=unclassified Methylophaga TaxID=2629249 RepID=UPI000C97B2A0|nr:MULTISPECIES: SUF system Fe-S cluster assembly protein [unclassified Methylophaga]MAK65793.1 SUF system Fe-S cluster assembly protein [Methylophaga sp.]MAY16517.1 SUF system Fe-S cluster assembly protein [Methylophaga sp.]MBN44982.1 SUF system Fe-S cluster assembly protein [Methylophaga sp.]HAO23580.1 SUF system Fe-S cluster assembly protein [Methylophaga sp.]HCD05676.1 SUF system Fe-S cluster assembly protein [Methylophaga sp.]|tara:strand:+ start:19109 stop:19444 length:336 start_codon:yes stop_codon:yes gene_type:complete
MNDNQVQPFTAEDLKEDVIEMLKTIFDPEIPVNIYELGLIYEIDVSDSGNVVIQMTLTAPGCPVAQTFPGDVENKISSIDGVNKVHVELVWDPPWTRDQMSESAQLQLGMF